MESQDSPTVIPCSEEMIVEENYSLIMPPPDCSSVEQDSEDVSQNQSSLANTTRPDIDVSTIDQNDISSINTTLAQKSAPKRSIGRDSVINSTMDLDSTEVNPMSSTRIEQDNSENSVSLLNEGFMIDSASLSLSAINEDRLGLSKTNLEAETTTDVSDVGGVESPEPDGDEDEVMENESEESSRRVSKRKEPVGSDEDDDDDENIDDYPLPQFPMGRIKKIMAISAAAEDEEGEVEIASKSKKDQGGKAKGNMMINKEAIYLTALATEHFLTVIGDMAGKVTTSNKKKTVTLEHLKRALSDNDAFAFLEGCFQPSLIIGD